jgi:hypothetical protein
MNDFRNRVVAGRPLHSPLLHSKRTVRAEPSRAAEEQSFADLSIARQEVRVANHRESDRYRLDDEAVEVLHEGRCQSVALVNVSGGGAMIEGAKDLCLWDRVELRLGGAEGSHVEAAVRWIRGTRHGLEFAYETRIDAAEDELADMLRAVIARSFPDILLETPQQDLDEPEVPPAAKAGSEGADRNPIERALRHPLIWSGLVHYEHWSHPVRLRNISVSGAMIDCRHPLQTGAELLLDLQEAGTIFAVVSWARGDAAGLRFQRPYDLGQLVKARPEVAGSRYVASDHLRDAGHGNRPWSSQWDRHDLGALQRRLGLIRRP